MKLVVPHLGTPQATDARLMRLAALSGLTCAPLFLGRRDQHHAEYMDNVFCGEGDCLVVNPRVIKEWSGGHFSHELASCLTSRFPYLLVHGLTPDVFCGDLIKALSGGRLQSVQAVADSGQLYEIAPDTKDMCGPFTGMSFGPINAGNDNVLAVSTDDVAVRKPISIGGGAFMAVVKRDKAEIIFLASADTLDVNKEIGDVPVSEYFSRFVPHSMALRYIFGEQAWHPSEHSASFIIDDPLLRPRYGYLDFGSLLNLMKEYNFSSTVAFIPHNYRRSSKRTVQMFRQSGGRLSICFHGNDHTAGELASADISRLNAMIRIAEARMDAHTKATGLPCPKVMVFPQDMFSVEAMKVLKSHNFCAAVSGTSHPAGRRATLTLGEETQPAVLQHGKFPLFLRKFIGHVKRQDVASNLFFGQPVLVHDHHKVFRHAQSLVDDILMINSIAPEIQWCNLEAAVMNSTLRRRTPNGVRQVRAYSNVVPIANDSDSPQRYLVEWGHSAESCPVEQVLQGGAPIHSFEVDGSTIRLSVELGPRSRQTFSVVYRNDYSSVEKLGLVWSTKAFIRRRLSEVRDNYISKNGFAMTVAQALRRHILSKTL
jgi:hypothetical protein